MPAYRAGFRTVGMGRLFVTPVFTIGVMVGNGQKIRNTPKCVKMDIDPHSQKNRCWPRLLRDSFSSVFFAEAKDMVTKLFR